MYVVVGYHGLDDQCITVGVANMECVPFVEGDIIHFSSELLGRPLVPRVYGRDRSFPYFSEIAVLGSSRLSSEVWPAKDNPDFIGRSCFTLIIAQLGVSIVDVILEISLSDEFFDLILKHNSLLCGVANIFVIPAILVMISL